MKALIDKLVSHQRQMVLDYRFDFKDKLVAKLSELNKRLAKMDRPCVDDQ